MLEGIHKTSKNLADGTHRDYYYAWKNGPRLTGSPGSPEFIEGYYQATKGRMKNHQGTLEGLIEDFEESTDYTKLGDMSKRDYQAMFKLIRKKFGSLPIQALKDRKVRKVFKDWRDTMSATPRKADRAWSTLKRIFSVAEDNCILKWNPCNRGGKLYKGSRKDIIWTDDEVKKFKASAPKHVLDVFIFGLLTGQRQGDILNLKWNNCTDTHLNLKQSKTGRDVSVKIHSEVRKIIESLPRDETALIRSDNTVLTSSRGTPWTRDGFQTSWKKALIRTGIKGKTFHDLKGTFVTQARRNGSSIENIAETTGNSIKDTKSTLETHYMASNNAGSDNVIQLMEKHKK